MNKGICQLSEVPIRKETASSSEMVSMLLFGESYHVLEELGDWMRIRIEDDGYEGWISQKQFSPLLKEKRNVVINCSFPVISARSENEIHYLLPGSHLPEASENGFSLNDKAFAAQVDLTGPFQSITDTAMKFLNAPYLWGGRSLFGIDCSGLTQVTYKLCGIQLLRDAKQQATQGEEVPFREASMPGDLAFFDNAEGTITHVGIMLSPDRIIHASGKVRIDAIDQYGIIDSERKEYSHKLRIIKRIRQRIVNPSNIQ